MPRSQFRTGAAAYKAGDGGAETLQAYGVVELVAGFLAAWMSAMLSVIWMVSWLQRRGLALFGWRRIAAATLVVVLFA